MTRLPDPDFPTLRREYRIVAAPLGYYRVFHGDCELHYTSGAPIESKAAAKRLIDADIRSRTLVQRARA